MSAVPAIDVSVVQQLIAGQFPQWSHLAVRPVERDGWDNRTFRLGDELSVRLPSASGYVPQVDKEVRWLPPLAEALSLPIPQILGVGVPGDGYPFPWTIRRWIEGTPLTDVEFIDRSALAVDLAGFLRELYGLAPVGPEPGAHSAGRGAPLHQWDHEVSSALSSLHDRIDVGAAGRCWREARAASLPPDGSPVWLHGDISPGNLLARGGRLSAVIDFGLAAVGDPACDLAIAWTWFDHDQREAFRMALGTDQATWLRGTGWALWKALITLDDPLHAPQSLHVLDALGIAHGSGRLSAYRRPSG